MKLAAISCLLIAGLAEASFVIQKTQVESPQKSRATQQVAQIEDDDEILPSQRYGIGALSNPSLANYKIYNVRKEATSPKDRRSHKSQGHGKGGANRGSVNTLSTNFKLNKNDEIMPSQRHGIGALSNPSLANYKMYNVRKEATSPKDRRSHKSQGHGKGGANRGSVNTLSTNFKLNKNGKTAIRKGGNGKLKNGAVSKTRNYATSSYGSKYSGANSFTFSTQTPSQTASRKSRKSKSLLGNKVSIIKTTKKGKSSKASRSKSAQNVTIDDFVYVTLPPNQWTQFYFSEVGQLPYSRWTFDIPSGQKCSLQVVDAYCAGDRFQADRRLDSGVEVPLLSTPVVPFNPVIAEQIRQGGNVNCTPFTTDPATAWASSSWSKGQVALKKSGNYKLILKSLLAPYGSGGAFVRLACETSTPTAASTTTTTTPSSNVCSYGSSPIKYIRQTLPFTQQATACQSYGLRPLDVTQSNIQDARSVLLNCAGSGTRAWISSYNGDNYRGVVGLSLHATQLADVGAISATPDASPLEGVLCQ